MGRAHNYFLFLAASVLQFLTTSSTLQSNPTNNSNHDLDALLALKASIFDPNNILPMNWSTSTSVCNWIGVTCNIRHKRVAAIDLPYRGLEGIIPPQLGNISFLVRLNVENNSFHGNLPSEIANLRRLKIINLDWNQFDGVFPSWLGALTQLQYLSMRHNRFSGSLSTAIFNATKLENIQLGYNLLTGNLPEEFSTLSKLQVLDIQVNQVRGPLPRALFNLSSLRILALTNNSLSGYIPTSMCDHLPQLQGLYLSFNDFEGKIPSGIKECSKLEVLSMSDNKLTGNIPREFWNLTRLREIFLDGNDIQGEIPPDIKELSRLEFLSLSSNKLSGNIPKEFWNLIGLKEIYIYGNDLQGIVHQEIGNLSQLEVITLRTNRLSGSIPFKLFNISTLQAVELQDNDFWGELPSNLGVSLPSLKQLRLGTNRLKGPIPLKLFNMSTVQVISLFNNDFSGELPSTLGVFLPNLEGLFLGLNKLSGFVLTSISNASRLRSLDIGYNQFTGSIPSSIGNLRFLQLLSLRYNKFFQDSQFETLISFLTKCRNLKILSIAGNPLNGFLPISIGNLSSSLQFFDSSYCGISGEIPSSIGNLSNLAHLDLQSNRLTGTIPITVQWLLSLQRLHIRNNEIEGTIPNEFCNLLNLGILDLGQNLLSNTIPSCIGNITSLRNLYLNSNNLTSNLPASFWSIKDIFEIDLSINYLTGVLPPQIDNFKALVKMNLSMNHFSGEIPSTIGALQDVQELSLMKNNLQGSIPESMKNMLSLQYLDLSFNDLTGVIPNALEKLSLLQYFNVSYNRLRGPIPLGGSFVNFTNLSFLSNEALCGAPWLQPCPTFKHKSRTTRVVLLVLLGVGFSILALVISLFLVRRLKRKPVALSGDLFPTITITCERVSFHEIRRMTNGFSESNLLGSGTFGSVYKGVCAYGMIWAIKVFDMQLQDAFKSFDRECEVLRCLRHRNLTKVISACSNHDFKALVLEYMPNGSLEKLLYLDDHFLDFMQRLDIMIDVGCGLEYLHYGYSVPVIHCDLKPSNILLDQDMVGHISDFGIAKLLEDEESVVRTSTLATFGYIAPEYGSEGLVSTRCDVYSFGIILMEIFTKKKPKDEMFTEELNIRRWIQESIANLMLQIIDPKLFKPEDELTTKKVACLSSILQLALSCTTNAPEERPNIKDVLVALQKIKIQLSQAN